MYHRIKWRKRLVKLRGIDVKKIFKVLKETFNTEVKQQMNKTDGILSLTYYFYYLVMIYLFGILLFKTQIYENLGSYFNSKSMFRFIFYIPNIIIDILPIFIILKFRKQNLSSIGLQANNKIVKSILLGVIGSIPFVVLNVIGPISSGMTINPNIFDLFWIFLFYLICIAFTEEVMFRGFLQTRIQGLIKNKWVGTIFVGVLFGLMHIPFQMLKTNMSPIDFIMSDLSHLLTTCVIHIYLVFLYRRNNNLIAPTIAHTLMDFSYAIFI
jgi:uncharacterized protein